MPGIVGFGAGAAAARQWLSSDAPEQVRQLRDRLERCLLAEIPGSVVNGGAAARLCNTLSIRFADVAAEELVIALDLNGVAVSGGSACQSGAVEPSHVLTAMGLSSAEARSSVRLSLARTTSQAEVDRAIQVIVAAVQRLRSR